MNFKRLTALVEIAFWEVTVLLLSKSPFTQKLFREGYWVFERFHHAFNPTKTMMWAISGWGLGFVIGFIASFLWR